MILASIHNIYKTLTATEQKIASYIISFPEKTVNMTARELADECGTVPSAINRMCKSAGIDGFSKLKILLASELGSDKGDGRSDRFDKDDGAEAIFGKVFASGISALRNTLKMIDFSVAEKVAEAISSAGRVFIFGVGTSAVVASDAAYRFSQLGVQSYAYTDILQMNVMAKNMKKGDVAFGISHSGSTKAVVDAVRSAKSVRATTVCLTSFSRSRLFTESDYAISVYADEENYPVEAVSARIAHMCIVDSLMMTIASLDYENYSKHISLRNTALDEIRY